MGIGQWWLPGLKRYLKQLKNKRPKNVPDWPCNNEDSGSQNSSQSTELPVPHGGRALGQGVLGLSSTKNSEDLLAPAH